MPSVVLWLFAGQGTGRTDGESGDYMLPSLGSITTQQHTIRKRNTRITGSNACQQTLIVL